MRSVYPSMVKTAKSILKNKRSLEIEKKNYIKEILELIPEQNKFCDKFILFIKKLNNHGINFFVGVPDSLLKILQTLF